MKKLAVFLLCTSLMLGGASIATASVTLMQATGIMTGDTYGNMNLTANVTRAEFAKMLVSASEYQDSVTSYGASLFSDVKADHWANSYIKIAVEQGWITGYTDGSYKPENSITAAEAYLMSLRLLEYDLSGLTGNYEVAVLDYAAKIGLDDGITNTGTFTRNDCVTLFTNILNAQMSDGTYYATTLGYSVSNGEIDISSVTLSDLNGPYIYTGSLGAYSGLTVYIDDELSSSSALSYNDVYYVNDNNSTIYAYTDKVYGTVSAISPSLAAPTTITINGVTYDLGTNDAKVAVSLNGSIGIGDSVTLLLGMTGDVTGIVSGYSSGNTYYGVVSEVELTDTGSNVAVVCSDGTTRIFESTKTSFDVEDIVKVKVDTDITITELKSTSLSGKVSNNSLGGYTFASNAQIVDVNGDDAKVVYATELDGKTLSSSDIYYYVLDNDNNISHLILDNATGDMVSYGYLYDVTENQSSTGSSSGSSMSGTYEYYLNGSYTTLRTSDVLYNVDEGGIMIEFDGSSVDNMTELDYIKITSIEGLIASTGSKEYTICTDISVYVDTGDVLVAIGLTDINFDDYTIYGYVDDFSAGGEVRVIVAK